MYGQVCFHLTLFFQQTTIVILFIMNNIPEIKMAIANLKRDMKGMWKQGDEALAKSVPI